MEHRCAERLNTKLDVIILKQGLPVGVGVITNGTRWGVFVESDFKHLGSEQQISLSIVKSKQQKTEKSFEFAGLVIHKNKKGFGLEIDLSTQEQADLFLQMLKNSTEEKDYELTHFKKVANA